MFERLREDIACIRERDPAARSTWEVLTCYPGLHAVVLHRQAAWWWRHGFHWTGRWVSHVARFVTGIELPLGLPLEELLFFVVVPICGLLTYEAVGAIIRARRKTLKQGGRA